MEGIDGFGFGFYVPDSIDEVMGNGDAVNKLRRYADDIEAGVKRKPLMLHGSPGTGKTISAYLIAKLKSWHVVEMNAGDYRDKDSINRVAASAAGSRYLFGGRNMILFDEVDELMPRYDTGASSAIENLVSMSASPIIFIADDPWDQSIRFLRAKVETVEFKRIGKEDIGRIVEAFLKRYGLELSRGVVELIAARSRGDARSAINDAWTLAGSNEEDLSAIGMRNSKEEIFGVLDKVFLSYTLNAPLMAITNSDEDADMMVKWIDENLTKRYTEVSEASKALDNLAMSTVYYSRASRSQYYTYWRYMNVLMSSGVALSKEHAPSLVKRYSFPRVIKALSESKEDRGMEARIAGKLARYIHAGMRRIEANEMRMLSSEAKDAVARGMKAEEVADILESRFQLDGKETEYLLSKR